MRKTASFLAALFLGATAMAADFTGRWKLNLEEVTGNKPKRSL